MTENLKNLTSNLTPQEKRLIEIQTEIQKLKGSKDSDKKIEELEKERENLKTPGKEKDTENDKEEVGVNEYEGKVKDIERRRQEEIKRIIELKRVKVTDQNFNFAIFGVPCGFDEFSIKDKPPQSYLNNYYGEENDKSLSLRKSGDNFCYTYRRNHFLDGSTGRPGSLLGMNIELEKAYVTDTKTLLELFDQVFEKIIVERYKIVKPRSNTKNPYVFNIKSFKEVKNQIKDIKDIILYNLQNTLKDDILKEDGNIPFKNDSGKALEYNLLNASKNYFDFDRNDINAKYDKELAELEKTTNKKESKKNIKETSEEENDTIELTAEEQKMIEELALAIESAKKRIAEYDNDMALLKAEQEAEGKEAIKTSDIQTPEGKIKKENTIYKVEFLKSYCEKVEKYFEDYDIEVEKMKSFISKLKELYPDKVEIIDGLYRKFEENNSYLEISKNDWIKRIEEIIKIGETSDKDTIRIIKQISETKEREREFKRILIHGLYLDDRDSEITNSYTGNALILAEELRNISRFMGENLPENDQGKIIEKLMKSAETIGMDFDYIPLFENYIPYAKNTRLIDKEINEQYKEIKGLKHDDIKQVFSYGFNYGDKEDSNFDVVYNFKTMVQLASREDEKTTIDQKSDKMIDLKEISRKISSGEIKINTSKMVELREKYSSINRELIEKRGVLVKKLDKIEKEIRRELYNSREYYKSLNIKSDDNGIMENGDRVSIYFSRKIDEDIKKDPRYLVLMNEISNLPKIYSPNEVQELSLKEYLEKYGIDNLEGEER